MSEDSERLRLWVWLSLAFGTGNANSDALTEHFEGDIRALYDADGSEYTSVIRERKQRIRSTTVEKLCDKSLETADAVIGDCRRLKIGILTQDDPMYPKRLARIISRPIVLYYVGKPFNLDENAAIAIVGTRSMTEYGQRCAYTLAYDLSRGGAVIVSGLARGVDGTAHRGCLDASGKTVAVVGCGLDRMYPAEHRDLAVEIARSGVIFSEYPPGTPPASANFPMRNRIISGISVGTVVIEAGRRSGALITARDAIRQGRDIFAIPGKVGEYNSVGTNDLIQDGAKMVTNAADILAEYEAVYPKKIDLSAIPAVRVGLYHTPDETMAKIAAGGKEDSPEFISKCDRLLLLSEEKAAEEKRKSKKEGSGTKKETPRRKAETGIKEKAPGKNNPAEKKKETVRAEDMIVNPAGFAPPEEGTVERAVLDLLPVEDEGAITPDELSEKLGKQVREILTALTVLEITRYAVALPGGQFARKTPI